MGGHMVQGNQAVGIGIGGQNIIGQQGPMPGGPIQQAMINQNPGPQQGNPGQQQQQPAMMNPALNPGAGKPDLHRMPVVRKIPVFSAPNLRGQSARDFLS